jgi:hypothetical protein
MSSVELVRYLTITNMTKTLVAASALTIMLAAGTAFAQTYTYPTTGTSGTTGTTGTTDPGATGTVGVPNTGAGGNAVENEAILGASALAAIAAAGALIARRKTI